jgi:phospholipid/cholesterol/gamma-HCH transport system substrate-binding protein
MNTARSAILVGVFVIISLALVVVGVAWTKRGIGTGDDTYKLFAMFDDVTGVAVGTKVTIAGFTVGRVEELTLKGTLVRVDVRLKKSVTAWSGAKNENGELKNGALLQRLQASMLGDYYLELTPGATGKPLKDGQEIPRVITATALQQTMDKLKSAGDVIPKIDKIASDVGKITDNAAKVFGGTEGREKMEAIADNLVAASRELNGTVTALRERLSTGVFAKGGDLDRGLKSFASTTAKLDDIMDRANGLLDSGGDSALRSLHNIEIVTKNVRELVGENKEDVNSTIGAFRTTLDQVRAALAKVPAIMDELAGAAKNVNFVTKEVADGKGSIGRLLTDDTLVKDAESITHDAKELIHRYQALETGIDYKLAAYAFRQNNPENLSWQSHLTLRLQMREDKAVWVTLSGNNLGKVTTFTRVTSSTVSSGSGSASQPDLTEKLRQTDSSWTLGVQYARRFGPVTLHGGLIESTAGGGLDFYLFRDALIASAEIFRFTDDTRPRLRAGLTWKFLPYLYAWAGGDELLYPSTRADLFYGMGISFTDNDLKILLGSAPSIR